MLLFPFIIITESEQDFPSLGNQKSSNYLRSVAKKNLKKNSLGPKKAKKKKRKANSQELKDNNNNIGQATADKPREDSR